MKHRHSQPVAVEVIQLLLDVAADAASIVSVQPLPHHAHPVLPLVFVECKVLYLGSDATAAARVTLFRHRGWCPGGPKYILTGMGKRKSEGMRMEKKSWKIHLCLYVVI